MSKKILLISFECEAPNIKKISEELKEKSYECSILDGSTFAATSFGMIPSDQYVGLDVPIRRFNEKFERGELDKKPWIKLKKFEEKFFKGRNLRQIIRSSPIYYNDHHFRKPYYQSDVNDNTRLCFILEIIEWYVEEIKKFNPDVCFCVVGNYMLKVLAAALSESLGYKFCCLTLSRFKNYLVPLNDLFLPMKSKTNMKKKILKARCNEIFNPISKDNLIYKKYDAKVQFKLNKEKSLKIQLICKNLYSLGKIFYLVTKNNFVIAYKKLFGRNKNQVKLYFFKSKTLKRVKFFFDRFLRKTFVEWNYSNLFVSLNSIRNDQNNGIKFILFTLHVLPESSVLTFSKNYYEEDYIKYISTNLPVGYKLLVKEHSEMIGDRPISFYKRMIDLGNVVLLDPNASPNETLTYVSGVLGISGTSILEGIINKKPCGAIGIPEFINLILPQYRGLSGLERYLEDLKKDDLKLINETKIYKYIENIIKWEIKWTHTEWLHFMSNSKEFVGASNVISSTVKLIEKLANEK